MAAGETAGKISIVIPVHNERESIRPLHSECVDCLRRSGRLWEVIVVDDGSTDGSFDVLRELCRSDGNLKAARLRTHMGKAAALSTGFRLASGEWIVTLDGDLQDDPGEIPRLLDKLGEGYDLVSGWKHKRRDSLPRVMASRAFNGLVRWLWKVPVRDLNSGFKAYRREVLEAVSLYGELHRFIPLLAFWQGFRVGEVPVTHRRRRFGRSRYRWTRGLKAGMDLMTVMFLTRYDRRPAHFFGLLGLLLGGLGGAICFYIATLRLRFGHIMHRHPLLIFGVLLVVVGVQLMATGLLGEIMAEMAYRRQAHEKIWVAETVGFDDHSLTDARVAGAQG